MRILITGAGGASAISVWKSLSRTHELYMADIDPYAAGLYVVPPQRRFIVPRGDSPNFARRLCALCEKHKIRLLIPTVDSELVPVALARLEFEKRGIQVAISEVETLRLCRDKYALIHKLRGHVPVPKTVLLTSRNVAQMKKFPLFVKPRISAGSRGAILIKRRADLSHLPHNGSLMLQEYLPGAEFSVDTYVREDGIILAVVPRERLKTDSGIAVTARTVESSEAIEIAASVLKHVPTRYVANIQLKRSVDGVLKLLEINPRFPGTLPLTAKAGIDLPKLLAAEIAGKALPSRRLPFREVAVVRYWAEHYLSAREIDRLCRR